MCRHSALRPGVYRRSQWAHPAGATDSRDRLTLPGRGGRQRRLARRCRPWRRHGPGRLPTGSGEAAHDDRLPPRYVYLGPLVVTQGDTVHLFHQQAISVRGLTATWRTATPSICGLPAIVHWVEMLVLRPVPFPLATLGLDGLRRQQRGRFLPVLHHARRCGERAGGTHWRSPSARTEHVDALCRNPLIVRMGGGI